MVFLEFTFDPDHSDVMKSSCMIVMHSREPKYPGHHHYDDCPYIEGKCYTDTNGTYARSDILPLLIICNACEDLNPFWFRLEKLYCEWFDHDKSLLYLHTTKVRDPIKLSPMEMDLKDIDNVIFGPVSDEDRLNASNKFQIPIDDISDALCKYTKSVNFKSLGSTLS